jgi:GAF domain-containing protein
MPPQAPDLAAAAQRLVTEARVRLAVGRAALFLRRLDNTLVCVATAGQGDETAWVGQALRAGVGVAGRTVAEGRPVWSPDLLADPRIPVSPWLRERLLAEGLRSVLAAPLPAAAGTLGALGVLDGAGRAYTEGETRLLADLARAATPAIEAAWPPELSSARAGATSRGRGRPPPRRAG